LRFFFVFSVSEGGNARLFFRLCHAGRVNKQHLLTICGHLWSAWVSSCFVLTIDRPRKNQAVPLHPCLSAHNPAQSQNSTRHCVPPKSRKRACRCCKSRANSVGQSAHHRDGSLLLNHGSLWLNSCCRHTCSLPSCSRAHSQTQTRTHTPTRHKHIWHHTIFCVCKYKHPDIFLEQSIMRCDCSTSRCPCLLCSGFLSARIPWVKMD